MPKLPIIKAQILIKILKKRGFVLDRVKGSHHVIFHSVSKLTVVVPVHKGKDLGRGITLSILADAKISLDEFMAILKKK